MPPYSVTPEAFEQDWCQCFAANLLESAEIHGNQLSDAFYGSRGLQIIFHASAKAKLKTVFRELFHILENVTSRESNAFFLNILVTKGDFEVRRHVDCSLDPLHGTHITPSIVSVTYIQTPKQMRGGELELLVDNSSNIARIRPLQGMLVQFDGSLVHGVSAGRSSEERISVVIEEYCLSKEHLSKIPVFSKQAPLDTSELTTVQQSTLKKAHDFLNSLSKDESQTLLAALSNPPPRD